MFDNENKDAIALTVESFKDIEDIWTDYFKTMYDETLVEMEIKVDNTLFPRNVKLRFVTDKNVFSSIYYPSQFNITREHQNYTKPEEPSSDSVITEVIPQSSSRSYISYNNITDEQIMEIGAYIKEHGAKKAKEKYNIYYPTCRKILDQYQERIKDKKTDDIVEETTVSETTTPVVSEDIETSIIEDTINGDSVDKVSKKYKISVETVQQIIVDHWKFIENKKRIKKGKLVDKRIEEFKNAGKQESKPQKTYNNSGNTIADQIGASGMSVIDEFFSNDQK